MASLEPIPHDFYCQEGTKNVSFISVRNIDGQNHSGHTVTMLSYYDIPSKFVTKMTLRQYHSKLDLNIQSVLKF